MRLDSPWTGSLLYWTAVAFGLAYALLTPIFTVPDEAAHFFRGLAVARGSVAPAPARAPVAVEIRDDVRVFAWHVQDALQRSGRYDLPSLRVGIAIRPSSESGALLVAPFYTPLPYVPQAIVSALGLAAEVRPLLIFYAGRLVNLAVWMGIIALAAAASSRAAPLFAAAALLPMTLFLFASWSADAALIALAFLFTALALRSATAGGTVTRSEIAALALAALLLALCKPVYNLLPALVLAIPGRRFHGSRHRLGVIILVGAAAVMGTLVSMTYFDRGYFNLRAGLPIDPSAQARCIAHDPLRLVRVIADDFSAHGYFYAEQAVGRFGHTEVFLPDAVVWAEWAALGLIALTAATGAGKAFRITALGIAVVTSLAIVVSQYLIWSVACGEVVEGVQGRYFLPVIPLLGIAVGGWVRRPLPAFVLLLVAVICNGAAIATLLVRYW